MAGNTYGKCFRVTTWGESHGTAVGAVIDGCPPGFELDMDQLQREMDRRKPGQGGASSPRKEPDKVEVLSGIFSENNEALPKTTGTPISLAVYNADAHSKSYDHLREIYRPGHGDITYTAKYGLRDHRGGGRSSARETAARVAAGGIADQILKHFGMQVYAYTISLGGVRASQRDMAEIGNNLYYCPDKDAAEKIDQRVKEVRKQGDTLGGIVEIRATCPPGLGEPVFDKLEAELAHGLMSIGAVKGVEFGSGFAIADMLGSESNDAIRPDGFQSNNAGGTLAGISSGQELIIRVAVKPIPSIGKEQQTINRDGDAVDIQIGGRHDISAIPRVIPVCEAMVRITLLDHLLRQNAIFPKKG